MLFLGSETFSVRIPKKLKEDMKKLPVNWQEEVRSFIEGRVRAEKARLLVEEAKLLRDGTKKVSSAELIREDRSR
ncbi:MAG: hypothetical protein QXN15_09160 [Candidatus Jordarchaeales archaeon]